ncbi:MAG: hypothetical protein WCJ30_27865 [Deltaproteobacteria bacterium]
MTRASTCLVFTSLLALGACSSPTTPTDTGSVDTAPQDGAVDASGDAAVPDAAIDSTASDAVIDAGFDATSPPDGTGDVPAVDGGCAFDTSYHYGSIGGFRVAQEDSTLSPQATWSHTRTPVSGSPASCTQTIPCGTSGLLDVRVVVAAIGAADVQAAMALGTDTLYGIDSRPVDGSVFSFQRASDGHSILVGGDCGASTSCRAIPPGVAALVTVLRNLDVQELALPGCEALR